MPGAGTRLAPWVGGSLLLTGIGELTTNEPGLPGVEDPRDPTGVVHDAAVLLDGDRVAWAGPERAAGTAVEQLLGRAPDRMEDLGGRAVLPGFVDSHTHLVFAGDRAAEFEARMAGRPYAAGGIRTTVAATRAASDAELRSGLRRLAAEALSQGTTTLEVKSGYGLTVVDEPPQPGPQLRVGRRARRIDRRADPAGRVRASGHARLELGRAVAREYQVCVRVHEPGQHGPPAEILHAVRVAPEHLPDGSTRLALGPHPGHTVTVEQHRGIVHDAGRVARVVDADERRGVRGELGDPGEEQRAGGTAVGHHDSRMGTRRPPRSAAATASSYPASTCRSTPRPGSLDSTRASLAAARSVPSATDT